MKKSFLIFSFFASLLLNSSLYAAQDPARADSLWNSANAHYAAAGYQEALNEYLQIEGQGIESATLYYNMGNTYFKMRYVPQAILYYEKALTLDPGNKDIAYNLSIAQQECIDKIEAVPSFFLAQWVKDFRQSVSSNAWAWIFVALLALALLLLLAFYFARGTGWRKTAFILSMLLFLLAAVGGSFAWKNRADVMRKDTAIVFSAVSSVKSSPDTQGKDLLVVHEGTKVVVLEQVGEWARIELMDGRQGWILLSEIVFVY